VIEQHRLASKNHPYRKRFLVFVDLTERREQLGPGGGVIGQQLADGPKIDAGGIGQPADRAKLSLNFESSIWSLRIKREEMPQHPGGAGKRFQRRIVAGLASFCLSWQE
jgi:hypothetical protein